MSIKPIHTEHDYELTLQRVEQLMQAEPDTDEGDELEILSTLVQDYEDSHHAIEPPHPIEAIRFRMEQMNLKVGDLGAMLNTHSHRIYEILNRSRPLTLTMIRRLNKNLHISAHVLIQDYALRSKENQKTFQ